MDIWIWFTIALLIINIVLDRREFKKSKSKLLARIITLEKDNLIWRRAQLKDLVGEETRDLHDLVFYHEQGDSQKFDDLYRGTSKKVRGAFKEWKEWDKPKEIRFTS